MFVRLKKSARTVNPVVQIVESVREGGKVKQKVLASLGTVKDEEDLVRLRGLAENLLRKLQLEKTRQQSLFAFEQTNVLPTLPKKQKPKKTAPPVNIEDLKHKATVYDGFLSVVNRLFELTGFDEVGRHFKGAMSYNPLQIVKLLVSHRLAQPSSKLRSYERQNDFGFHDISLQHIYRSMDKLLQKEGAFQKKAIQIASPGMFKDSIECLFVDVTTLYYESVQQDEIKNFGYSKDQKYHCVQIVLCLSVNIEGLPLAYEIFPGNTADVSTLVPFVDKLREKFEVKKVTVVCDRGMASLKNIEHLRFHKMDYIVACKVKHLPKEFALSDLNTFSPLYQSSEDEVKFKRLPHPSYPGTELIVTWSKKRDQKDKHDRDKLLERLEAKLGEDASSPKIRKLITNSGYKKFVHISNKGASWAIDDEALKKEESWDGIHALAVSSHSVIATETALSQYKNLWRVEEAFRVSKSTLEIRPMFHWTERRIRSHVLICFVTLFLERYLERLLAANHTKLTPDRIRYALGKVHNIYFTNAESGLSGVMQSTLDADARAIFTTLGLSTSRGTHIESSL